MSNPGGGGRGKQARPIENARPQFLEGRSRDTHFGLLPGRVAGDVLHVQAGHATLPGSEKRHRVIAADGGPEQIQFQLHPRVGFLPEAVKESGAFAGIELPGMVVIVETEAMLREFLRRAVDVADRVRALRRQEIADSQALDSELFGERRHLGKCRSWSVGFRFRQVHLLRHRPLHREARLPTVITADSMNMWTGFNAFRRMRSP